MPTLKPQEHPISEEKFNEQLYMIHNFDSFVSSNKNINYDNFVQLLGDPALILNRLLSTGISKMINIKPEQLSLMQPKLKFYKTVFEDGKEKDLEIIFEEYIDNKNLDNLLKNRGQRGIGVGLKKFEWEDLGTNPGDSGKTFKSTLIIELQSLMELYVDRGSGALIVDLIRSPPSLYSTRGVYNDQHFRIKVQIGWQEPTEHNSFFSQELKDEIKLSTVTLFLTLTNHSLDIKENGSITLTIEYIGAIEGKMLSPETNILYVSEKDKTNTILNIEKNLQTRRTQIAEFNKKKEKFEDEIDYINKEIEEFNKNKEILQRENLIDSYKRFLTFLEVKNRIFFVDLDKQAIRTFLDIKKNFEDIQQKKFTKEQLETERIRLLAAYRNSQKNQKINPKQYDSKDISDPLGKAEIEKGLESTLKTKNIESFDKTVESFSFKQNNSNDPKNPDKTRINFIYLGDIIDTAVGIISEDKIFGNTIIRGDKKDQFKFLLGTIKMENIFKEINQDVPLADIPISLDLFNAWFLKKVIRPKLNEYLLRDFLRDICSELVTSALSSTNSGPYTKSVLNKIGFSVFSMHSKGGNDPFNNLKRANILTFEDFSKYRNGKPENIEQYMLFYVSGYFSDSLKGKFEDDQKVGIYHFYVGADRGLLKSIKFAKTDMQYIKEARIADADKIKKGDAFLSEPYNATMEMWGNSIYKPGMIVYIDPASIGMPKSVPIHMRLIIGGYFNIVKVSGYIEAGSFKTQMDLNFQHE